jgi:hypothetical protein
VSRISPDILIEMRKLKLRYYWVDEDGEIRNVPAVRYQRIFGRTDCVRLFAGKTVNFIVACVSSDVHSQKDLVRADFTTHAFDADGKWCVEQKEKMFRGAAKMLSCGRDETWQELYRHEYLEPHQWKPTELMLEKLKELIRTPNKRS